MSVLKLGDSGAAVRNWQTLLVSKGFVIDVDGGFGVKTEHATRVAQEWAGVTVDGLVGPKTLAAVNAKTRTRRPGNVVRHVIRAGWAPKILDVRDGKHGFPHHVGRNWEQRAASELRAKLGHYSGGPASFLADANFHVHSDYLTKGGAPAIAYHLGVDVDGTLFVFNDWSSITWHCDGGHNTDTLGIVFRGGAEGPTLPQRRTLGWLWKQLAAGAFRPTASDAKWPALTVSTTHMHVNATTCPGVKGEAFYRSISPNFVTGL